MRIRDYTAIVLTLVALGACTKAEPLPPAIPEERTLEAVLPADLEPPEGEHTLVSELTSQDQATTHEWMRSDARWYRELRQRPRRRAPAPALGSTGSSPVHALPRPSVAHPPTPGWPVSPAADITTIAYQPQDRGVPSRRVQTLDVERESLPPRKAEAPEQVIRRGNSTSLVTPRREWMSHGVLHYPFEAGRTYLVLTAPDEPTLLALPEHQRLAIRLKVDKEKFDIGYPERDPNDERADTIVIHTLDPESKARAIVPILTKSGMRWWVELRSVPRDAIREVTWRIAEDTLALYDPSPHPAASVVPLPGLPSIDPTRLHHAYTLESTGNPTFLPVRVFDDGQKTYIQFRESLRFGAAPAVASVHADGGRGLVEWTAYEVPEAPDQPSYYVVSGLWPRLVLRGQDGMEVRITRGLTRRALTMQEGGSR